MTTGKKPSDDQSSSEDFMSLLTPEEQSVLSRANSAFISRYIPGVFLGFLTGFALSRNARVSANRFFRATTIFSCAFVGEWAGRRLGRAQATQVFDQLPSDSRLKQAYLRARYSRDQVIAEEPPFRGPGSIDASPRIGRERNRPLVVSEDEQMEGAPKPPFKTQSGKSWDEIRNGKTSRAFETPALEPDEDGGTEESDAINPRAPPAKIRMNPVITQERKDEPRKNKYGDIIE